MFQYTFNQIKKVVETIGNVQQIAVEIMFYNKKVKSALMKLKNLKKTNKLETKLTLR